MALALRNLKTVEVLFLKWWWLLLEYIKISAFRINFITYIPKKHYFRGYIYMSSTGEESACSAADSGLIPGSGRSPEEGAGSPLQCSWASLAA